MHHRPLRLAALGLGIAALVGAAPLGAAASTPAAPAPTADDADYRVVASGLDNPRQLALGVRDRLYVAESGVGGDGPCIGGAEGRVCFGASGAVTKVRPNGTQRRILTGLPSLAATDGSAAAGPSSVALRGKRVTVSVGLGNDPAVREDLPALGQYMGHIVRGSIRGGDWWDVIDVGAYEAAENPDGDTVDTNPNAVQRNPRGFAIADAGGNTVLQLGRRTDELTTLAVLPFLDLPDVPFPVSPVPTSLTRGPGGRHALYVGQLTGFPFAKGAASVLRLGPGGATTSVADNLTNITDVAYDGDTLYVVELAEEGLLNGPVGRLVRVHPDGTQETVAGGLFAPFGLVLHGDEAYVSTCSVCPDAGEVVAIPLD